MQSVGAADGSEQAAKGHQVSLSPNLNILRTPYGGRAFEGYGEDPYLSSQVAAADVRAAEPGVIATAKHYIGNDQEPCGTPSTCRSPSGRWRRSTIRRSRRPSTPASAQ